MTSAEEFDRVFDGCDQATVYELAYGWVEAVIASLDPADRVFARAQACTGAAQRRLDDVAADRRGPQR